MDVSRPSEEMTGAALYRYQLRVEHREIRILSLHPGTEADPISCSLKNASLGEKPKYTALSYVWGDPKSMKPILVSGQSFPVTLNLEAALRELRDVSSTKLMWIDAICINQSDMDERAQQVQLMGSLYAGASEVVIWLGKGDIGSDMLAEIITYTGLPQEPDPSSSNYATLLQSYSIEIRKIRLLLSHISSRAWWARIWCVQECVLPVVEPIFQCGKKAFAWSQFFEICKDMTEKLERLKILGSQTDPEMVEFMSTLDPHLRQTFVQVEAMTRALSLADSRKLVQERKYVSLSVAIFSFLGRAASVPHDYIHGILGLAPKEVTKNITVDYRRSPWKLYQEFMECWVSSDTENNFELFSLLSFARPKNDYPSWVPDFSAQQGADGNSSLDLAGDTCWQVPNIWLSDDGNVLMPEGIILDIVKDVHSITRNRDTFILRIRQLEDIAMTANKYPAHNLQADSLLHRLRQIPNLRRLFTCNAYSSIPVAEDKIDYWWEVLMGRIEGFLTIDDEESYKARDDLGGHSINNIMQRLMDLVVLATAGRNMISTKNGFVGIGVPNIQSCCDVSPRISYANGFTPRT